MIYSPGDRRLDTVSVIVVIFTVLLMAVISAVLVSLCCTLTNPKQEQFYDSGGIACLSQPTKTHQNNF